MLLRVNVGKNRRKLNKCSYEDNLPRWCLKATDNLKGKPLRLWGCLLSYFDTSIKFGTSVAVINTSILRYSAKFDIHWFPWKQQSTKSHGFLCFSGFISKHTFISMVPACLPRSFRFGILHGAHN